MPQLLAQGFPKAREGAHRSAPFRRHRGTIPIATHNGLGARLSVLNAKNVVAALNGTHRALAALVRGSREMKYRPEAISAVVNRRPTCAGAWTPSMTVVSTPRFAKG